MASEMLTEVPAQTECRQTAHDLVHQPSLEGIKEQMHHLRCHCTPPIVHREQEWLSCSAAGPIKGASMAYSS